MRGGQPSPIRQGGHAIVLPPLFISELLAEFVPAEIDIDILAENALRSGGRILLIVVVALVTVWVIRRALSPLVRVAIREQMVGEPEVEIAKRISTLSDVIYRTLLVVVVVLTIMTILPEFGINATALVAGLGLFGLALGFGAQNLVKDMINGIFILVENQYGKGDVVTVAGLTGVVEDMNLRRTVLRDLDGTVHSIPHSTIELSSNWTKSYSRINLNIGVAYESNLDHVIEVINRVGQELADDPDFSGRILDPPHVLRVDSFGDSAIVLKIIGETAPIEQWGIMGELRLRLKKAFDAEGIVIPFPQRTLHMATPLALSRDGTNNSASPPAAPEVTGTPEASGGGQPGEVRLPDHDEPSR